jgi:hypothetical protein
MENKTKICLPWQINYPRSFHSSYSLRPLENLILAFEKKSHKEWNLKNRSNYLSN